MDLKNRIAMAPMATDFAEGDGTISSKLIDYHEARGRGGVGLIISEVTAVDSRFPYIPRTVGLWDDSLIPGHRILTETVHSHGACIIPQIAHPGPDSLSPILTGLQTVGPSAGIRNMLTKTKCRELSVEEISEIVELFGETARRAKEAGYDGIELHAAHGYMLAGSFLTALRNRRTDEYGGPVESRLRFVLEIIKCIRKKTEKDFPIIIRISGDEKVRGGMDIRQTRYIAPLLEAAGVDAFHISSGVYPLVSWRVIPPTGTPQGLNTAISAAVKDSVSVPVMVVGRINDPRVAEDILEKKEADMVVMGRALLADPELPNKAFAGKYEDIVPCTGCGLGCVTARERGEDMTCALNPAVGREKEMALVPSAHKKKVLVAGGGPAGMEAALTAALRGHDVALYEKDGRLGGQFVLASASSSKRELTNVIKYYSIQIYKAGVKVNLETEATPGLVGKEKPDAVVVATGAIPLVPDIPGVNNENVFSYSDVLSSQADITPGNILIIGGGTTGCEAAECLACTGDNINLGQTDVTIVEMGEDIGPKMFTESRALLMKDLKARGVRFITSARVTEITSDGAVIEVKGKGKTISGFDSIVLATGAKSVNSLSRDLKDTGPEVITIGDAKDPRQALQAIAEGAVAGRSI
jgi:NAD(H)-dependent 7beta-hydroxy-3-oxo-delta4-cholenoic acid oxidoreductase